MFKLLRVRGRSMLPGLAPGDYVLATRLGGRPRAGARVIAEHPQYGTLVKRLSRWDERGCCHLLSDHHEGLSSEQMGALSTEVLYGRVIACIRQS